MKISCIIPALNEAAMIGPRLSALQSLRGRDVELVLADGGSSDATAELAAPRVDRLIRSPRGRAAQMNAGARYASGDVLWFLHLDCTPPPAAPEAIRAAIHRGRQWGRFDVRLSGSAPLLRVVERAMNLRSRITGIATGDQGMFVTRACFARVGGFPEIALMEDIALSRKLRREGRPACLRERLLASSRRWEAQGVIRTILLMWLLRAAYRAGVDPERLAVLYGYCPARRRPEQSSA